MFDGEITTETIESDDGSVLVRETFLHNDGGKTVYKTRTFPDGRVATGATNYGPDVSAVRLGEALSDLPLKLGGQIPDTGSVAYYVPNSGETSFHGIRTSKSEQAELANRDDGISVGFIFPHRERYGTVYVALNVDHLAGNDTVASSSVDALEALVADLRSDDGYSSHFLNTSASLSPDGRRTNYTLQMPVSSQADLDKVVKRFAGSFDFGNSGDGNSITDYLSKLGVPDAKLEGVVRFMEGTDPKDLKVTTTKTSTGLVLDFDTGGVHYYAKFAKGDAGKTLDKEAEGYKDAWTHPLLRPITPQFENLIHDGDVTVLVTKGTQNDGIISGEDLHAYFNLQRELFEEFARERNLNPVELMSNTALVDVFNMALRHTYMRDFVGKGVYQNGKIVAPDFEVFATRAGKTTLSDLLSDFVSLAVPYREAVKQYEQTEGDPRLQSVVNYSGKPENVFLGVDSHLRPQGDYGALAVGFPEYELAQLGVVEPTAFADPYLSFRQKMEERRGNKMSFSKKDLASLKNRVGLLSTPYATRIFSWELSRNFLSQANRQLDLARNYTH